MPNLTNNQAADLLAELEQAADLDQLRQSATKTPAAVALGLDKAGLRYIQRVGRRIFRDDRAAQRSALELLTPLPAKGRALHAILPGTFTPLDLIPALLEIIGQKATSLRLATLGFSVQNVEALCRMLDKKRVGRLSLICSRYFAATSKDIFAVAERELPKRGVKLLASRTHCKVMLVEVGSRGRWVFEGSGNLRSCVCLEQVAVTNDPQLFNFHRGWFDHVLNQNQQEAAP